MKEMIIYGGVYGTSKAYAEKLSERTGIPVMDYKEITNLSGYTKVVYIGGLYAGSITGLKETAKLFPKDAKIVVCSVGLLNPEKKENVELLRTSIRKQIPEKIHESVEFYHLRGAIDYQVMFLKHKIMMAGLCKALKMKPEEKKTEDDRMIINTYSKKADYVNFDSLNPVEEAIG